MNDLKPGSGRALRRVDEPCSALDPQSTLRIEELIREFEDRVTIVIVTHNHRE